MPIKIQTRENNTIITCNIFLNEGGYLEDLFQKITEVFEKTLEKINGETIHYELTKGKILDTGIQEFQIDLAKVWDIYLYDPEIFIYVRLLVESKLAQPKNSWISLDIDVITNSAWFL